MKKTILSFLVLCMLPNWALCNSLSIPIRNSVSDFPFDPWALQRGGESRWPWWIENRSTLDSQKKQLEHQSLTFLSHRSDFLRSNFWRATLILSRIGKSLKNKRSRDRDIQHLPSNDSYSDIWPRIFHLVAMIGADRQWDDQAAVQLQMRAIFQAFLEAVITMTSLFP